ncbi:TonB-dependent receptor [Mangrovimicrobium sediminis]|uniref:TonB-dependent receptor n=1 Tax=Mangrovimicrobium sediminis TaxID=2562682 RepID=A0A4Z0M677_9GAMM|nr:TonB-dependent receptor [Haliea sp. SAOS-164]TGD75183.1 TonB-dependent receptor [Haliea sp. SAOS-164]
MPTFLPRPLATAVIAATATLALAPLAQAQNTLEEVVVTAQKRAENVQDVPIAISVFTAENVEDLSARNLGDLGQFTAGVEMDVFKSLQPTYSIRGVQTNDWTVGSDPAVAVYIDGVYAARGAGAETALVDLARIEVLKGPQGTLFGRNATGGAIHLVTQDPVFEQEGRAKLSVGNYGRVDGELMWNQPLTDDLAVRVVAVSRNRDGYVENLNGTDLNDEDIQAIRGSLLWNPTPDTDVRWRLEYSELDQHSAARQTTIASVFENANPGRSYSDFGKIHTDYVNREARDQFATSLQVDHSFGDKTFTSITAWREFNTELDEDLDGSNNLDHLFNSNNPEENDYFSQEFRLTGASDKLKWTTGATFSREHVSHLTTAVFNVSTLESFAWAELLKGAGSETSDVFLATFAGQTPEDLEYLATLSNSEIDELAPSFRQQQRDAGLDGIAASSFVWAFLNGEGTLGDFGLSDNPFIGIFQQILPSLQPRIAAYEPWVEEVYSDGTYESYAVYGDATYSITDRMNLSAGLRYTYDEKEFSLFSQYQNTIAGANFGLAFYNNGQPLLDATQSDSWDNLSGRVVLDYALADDTMLYASVATGFKSGGFNSLNFGPDIDTSYDEEEVINYEVGSKGQYFDRSLQLNASAFFYDYQNLQELKLLGQPIPSYNLRNSDAEGYGIELETYWLATDNLTLAGNYSWLKTEYTKFRILEAAGETEEDDLTGKPRVGTPEHKVNLSAEYRWQLGDFGALLPRIDYTWSSERVESLNDPAREIDAFYLINARIALLPDNGDWEVALWTTNLTDEEHFGEYGDNGDAVGSLTGARIPPRMYGADFIYNF